MIKKTRFIYPVLAATLFIAQGCQGPIEDNSCDDLASYSKKLDLMLASAEVIASLDPSLDTTRQAVDSECSRLAKNAGGIATGLDHYWPLKDADDLSSHFFAVGTSVEDLVKAAFDLVDECTPGGPHGPCEKFEPVNAVNASDPDFIRFSSAIKQIQDGASEIGYACTSYFGAAIAVSSGKKVASQLQKAKVSSRELAQKVGCDLDAKIDGFFAP